MFPKLFKTCNNTNIINNVKHSTEYTNVEHVK